MILCSNTFTFRHLAASRIQRESILLQIEVKVAFGVLLVYIYWDTEITGILNPNLLG